MNSEEELEAYYNNIYRDIKCLFRYNILVSETERRFHVERTYELPYITVYMVVNQLSEKTAFYTKCEVLNIKRQLQKYKYDRLLLTKEVMGSNVHYNILMTFKVEDLCKLIKRNKINYHFIKPYIQKVLDYKSIPRIIRYMYKESMYRIFEENVDYLIDVA